MRELRKRRRISQKDAANHIQRNQSMLGRYESGEIPFRREDVMSLMNFYGVSSKRERNNLLELCDDVWQKNWWDAHREDLGESFVNVPWLESRVTHIATYQQAVVHGLMQTQDYAEALIRNGSDRRTSEDQIERWVNVRTERQQVLHNESPAYLSLVLEEAILARPVGGPEVMNEQIKHLLQEGERENIDIRVIVSDIGTHEAIQGSFQLYEMPSPYPNIAYIETIGGDLYVEEPNVSKIHDVWESLLQKALGPTDSAELIESYL